MLFSHDCVIVPNLGGFVANYAPAKVHPVQHVFNAPYKHISFNKNLKNNDGLLANHIVLTEGKTFDEANRILTVFVEESNAQLKQGNKITLDKIGALYIDIERNIQFEPDNAANYLVESFGLTNFQALPIKRDNTVIKHVTEFVDRAPIPQEKQRRKVGAYIATGVAVTMIVLLVWLPFKTDKINYSTLNPFAEKVLPLYTERTEIKPEINVTDFKSESKLNVINDTTSIATLSFVDNTESKLIVRLRDEVKPITHKNDKTSVFKITIKDIKNARYHVISGCFKLQQNAQKYLVQLHAKNIQANIIGKNKDGLYVVSCGDYTQQEDAYRELDRIRGLSIAAWMIEK